MNMIKPEPLGAVYIYISILNKNIKNIIKERENYANMLLNISNKHNALFLCIKNSSLRNCIKAISTGEEECFDEN